MEGIGQDKDYRKITRKLLTDYSCVLKLLHQHSGGFMKDSEIPVMLYLDREAYTKYKQLCKEKGLTPKVKLTEQANSFMNKQVDKG
jgi:uncharacterized protein YaaQ